MKLLLTLSLVLLSASAFAEQKVVLITGAMGGIGSATVRSFQQNGWKVWAGYRDFIPPNVFQLTNVSIIPLDVTDNDMIQNAIEEILAKDGRIDALVNNAGYGIISSDENISIEEAQKLFDVNFFGALRLTQAVIPQMRLQNGGHIINISSTSGVRAVPGLGMYAASKFALEGLSESLAVTLSPWNIKVAIVEPGSVRNNWVRHCLVSEKDQQSPIYSCMTEKLFQKLVFIASTAQDCAEIGNLIVEIAETKEPNMRYQTSEKVKAVVVKKLTDPSGNQLRNEQLNFFRDNL